MAYVPSNGRVYSFGLGANGQLGIGSGSRSLTPCSVVGPFVTPEGNNGNQLLSECQNKEPCVVTSIYAGGDHSFATAILSKVHTF